MFHCVPEISTNCFDKHSVFTQSENIFNIIEFIKIWIGKAVFPLQRHIQNISNICFYEILCPVMMKWLHNNIGNTLYLAHPTLSDAHSALQSLSYWRGQGHNLAKHCNIKLIFCWGIWNMLPGSYSLAPGYLNSTIFCSKYTFEWNLNRDFSIVLG